MASIGAVVLAAGGSTRLGQAKQLLTFPDGETLVHSAVRVAREGGCEIVCVVTGEGHEQVAQAVADLCPVIICNENWTRGIGSSIRLGVTQLRNVCAIVLFACDQPALDGAVVRALIKQREQTGHAIVASHYADTLGVPALFDRSCFADLERLPDGSGAKGLIEAEPARVAKVEFPSGELDLDSPENLQAWRRAQRSPDARY
jgi:molybdenum cofactor cytidylyltransferase